MQLYTPLFLLPFLAVVPIGTAAGAQPTAAQPISQARQRAFQHQAVEVLVHGAVTEAPGRLPADPRFFHIQDPSGGIAVVPPVRVILTVGDCVDVMGTATMFNDLEPQLSADSVTISHFPCAPPQPLLLSVDEVRSGKGSGGLVRVAGLVVDSSAGDDRALILVGRASSPLRIFLRRPGAALAEIRNKTAQGARVEFVGVSLPSPDGKSHYLRLRQPSDIIQRAPPPFHPHPGLLWLSTILVGVAAVTGIWIVTLRRIVTRKTREIGLLLEQARSASRVKSQFLANMSHEIRTPIHGIMGMQEMVLQSTLQPTQRESLEIAHSATRSLLSLLNDILDLSKIEADSMELSLETLDLPELMADLERQFRVSALLSSVSFEVHVDRDAPEYVIGDHVRLRQVLTNLLSNAFKFTSVGSVTMSCTLISKGSDTARLRFAVEDTGIGIPKAEQEKVFSAFHQADLSITRRFGGTGLGLTIVSRLVGLMHSRVTCESEEGVGSTFSFELDLPLARRKVAAKTPVNDGVPSEALRILLAEDNPINQLVVRRPLEALGHEVVVCENGLQAVSYRSSSDFDIVLMDVQMPVLDGLEAARRIRKWESELDAERVPILALTANSLREQVDQCFDAGMDACLCKPFLPAELLQLIAVHARSRKKASPRQAQPGA